MPFHEELTKLARKSPIAKAVGAVTKPIRRKVGDPLGGSIRRAEGAIKSYFRQGGAAPILRERLRKSIQRELEQRKRAAEQ